MATHVERSIEVAVPVRTAYDQWTQFEDFPRFMGGVQEVRQIGDALTHWVAEIAGVRREWDAAILEQIPDQKVAWAATTGATNAGAVYFQAVGTDRTQVRLTLDYEPEGVVEKIGEILAVIERQAVADLDRFKEFIEHRGAATGGWRGTVAEGGAGGAATATAAGAVAAGTVAGGGAGPAGAPGAGDPARTQAADVSGDLLAVGPTGGTRGTVSTDAGTAGTTSAGSGALLADEGPGVGHSGDPVAVDTQRSSVRTGAGGAGTAGPTVDAASSSTTRGVGFGTDTGLSSEDPASGVVTGDPGARTASHAGTGTGGFDDAESGAATGFPGDRPADHADSATGDRDDDGPGLLTGYPGERTTGAAGTADAGDAGPGFVTGYPGERTTGAAEAATADPDAGPGFVTGYPGDRTTGHGGTSVGAEGPDPTPGDVAGAGGTTWADQPGARTGRTGATTDPVGESWSDDAGDRPDRAEGPTTGTGGARPSVLDRADAPGPADGTGAALDPLDPRSGTLDDPGNPQRPTV